MQEDVDHTFGLRLRRDVIGHILDLFVRVRRAREPRHVLADRLVPRRIADPRQALAGKAKLGHNVTPAYFSQHASELVDRHTVVESMLAQARVKLTNTQARTILGRFLFSQDEVNVNFWLALLNSFIVASVVPNEIDEDVIGGMAASLLGVGERISADLMRAQMEQTYVRSPKGYIIINSVGPDASLVLLVTREAKLGLVFLELKRTIAELAGFL